jgi:hypothetical protein
MKVGLVLSFCVIFVEIDGKFHNRYTKIECKSSGQSVKNVNCFVKAFNRRSPVVNVEFDMLRKFDDLKVRNGFEIDDQSEPNS